MKIKEKTKHVTFVIDTVTPLYMAFTSKTKDITAAIAKRNQMLDIMEADRGITGNIQEIRKDQMVIAINDIVRGGIQTIQAEQCTLEELVYSLARMNGINDNIIVAIVDPEGHVGLKGYKNQDRANSVCRNIVLKIHDVYEKASLGEMLGENLN